MASITITIEVDGTGDARTAVMSLDDPRYEQDFTASIARDEDSATLNEEPGKPWVGWDDGDADRRFYATFEAALTAETESIAADAAAALCEENALIEGA